MSMSPISTLSKENHKDDLKTVEVKIEKLTFSIWI